MILIPCNVIFKPPFTLLSLDCITHHLPGFICACFIFVFLVRTGTTGVNFGSYSTELFTPTLFKPANQYIIISSEDESSSWLYLDTESAASSSAVILTCSFLSNFKLVTCILLSHTKLHTVLCDSHTSPVPSKTIVSLVIHLVFSSTSSLCDSISEPTSSFILTLSPQSIPMPNPNLISLSNVELSSAVSSPSITCLTSSSKSCSCMGSVFNSNLQGHSETYKPHPRYARCIEHLSMADLWSSLSSFSVVHICPPLRCTHKFYGLTTHFCKYLI